MTTQETIAALDRGELRVAEQVGDEWVVNQDVQAAILDFFRTQTMETREVGPYEYHDKIPLKTGSAEPEPEMLKLVDAIAKTVGSQPGNIVIRGHTDSRPYRNKYYDNGQLSSARANFARYMLIRGGVAEERIRRVEGVADLEPKNSKDPGAPENRRIEIFIGKEAP